jgi:DNA-binding XRE family transcriptional regulator
MNTEANRLPLAELARLRALCASGEAHSRRRSAGLGATEVADDIGASRHAVLKWEAGERRPSRTVAASRYLALLDALVDQEVHP